MSTSFCSLWKQNIDSEYRPAKYKHAWEREREYTIINLNRMGSRCKPLYGASESRNLSIKESCIIINPSVYKLSLSKEKLQ